MLLTLKDFSVIYPNTSTYAVDAVSLDLAAGDILGLVGESGCGKSTLGRAALRLLPRGTQIEGEAWFEERSIPAMSARDLRHFRGEAVSLVFQDPMTRLDPLMTIGDHCLETLLAHEPKLSRPVAKARSLAALESVNIPADRWSQYPHEFSGGMRQRVAIALALVLNPKLIVADEPTTSLDVTISAQILDELTRLCRERHMGLILISHDLALVAEYCDRVAVMYQGKLVELGTSQQVLRQPQHDYTRSLLQSALDLQQADIRDERVPTEAPLLEVRNLQKHYVLTVNPLARLLGQQTSGVIKAVDDVSFNLYHGEILGLVGESGCGKSTLSRTILQIIPPSSGDIRFLGQDITRLSRQNLQRQRRDMQMIFQDPHACLNPMMTVEQGIGDPLRIHQLGTAAEIADQVHAMMDRVGLTPIENYAHRFPGDLSGGQQQRVAIARALITRPKLIICDEPVSMLDASIQAQVLSLMLTLKEDFDLTYLFITHDLWVARYLCDRIAVMQAGKILEMGSTEAIFNQPQHPYTKVLLGAAPLLATQPT
ncbi:ABC transporter ATP-binding protein [Oscillatoria sp. CS-180]|uniref:dipeptide ABC transporter ATP-binding protein n=1 Tax=Oscillatoria sp. CS-180 TaxID=3021720 RepID=UPI0023313809|nr:ABC transporter ATP-binding protein [Oscillatoria sp. CS-180]MDB9529795.1 ABC transporter ATP-binding protein [Oscillatoria sp. CS-180]